MRYLKRAVVPVAVIAVVLSVMAGIWLHARTPQAAAAISAGCGQWTLVPGINPGTFNNQLFGVAAVSASNVWAVGDEGPQAGGPNSTLVEHWSGPAWNLVASPNISNAYQNVLESIAAVSSTDVWAVGYYYDASLTETFTLTEHWNGTSWRIVSSPNVGQNGGLLSGVSADASNDVWAVGSYYDPSLGLDQALIEHWDGSSWSIVPGGATSTGNALLNGVTALSATNAWAVGEGPNGTLIEHWDGTSWTIVASPNSTQGGDFLESVTATGPNDIWAVGTVDIANSVQTAMLAEHWDGTSWTLVPGYVDGMNSIQISAVANVPGSPQILAVGDEVVGSTPTSLVVRWNGTSWNRVQSSNQNSPINALWVSLRFRPRMLGRSANLSRL